MRRRIIKLPFRWRFSTQRWCLNAYDVRNGEPPRYSKRFWRVVRPR